jgi:hypothetical protein
MGIGKRFKALIPDLSATLARFPGPAVASLVLCIVGNLRVAERNLATDQLYTDLLWSGAAAFIASGSAHLFAESRGWAAKRNNAFALLIGLAAATTLWFHDVLGVHRWFSTVGLFLLLMTAAYLRPQASQAAFWLFNLRLGLAALLAILVTAAACGGISAVLASLEFLFEIKIPRDLYQHVWSTGITVVGPIYGLALTPSLLDEEVDRETLLYRARTSDCGPCPLKSKCCPKAPERKIPRSIYEDARDAARALVDTEAFKQSHRDRKRVEMLFAHLKRILKLGRLRLRGPCGAQDEFTLAAIAQNLRRLAKLVARPPPPAAAACAA